jgi:co-chaperonin GroES (HSP10)
MNTTGIKPTEFNVLVKLETASSKIGSILLPGEKQDRDQAMNTVGELVAASPLAFTYDSWDGVSEDDKPKVGDKVRIAKGAGEYITEFKDADGKPEFYRLVKDKDVTAIMEEVKALPRARRVEKAA